MLCMVHFEAVKIDEFSEFRFLLSSYQVRAENYSRTDWKGPLEVVSVYES